MAEGPSACLASIPVTLMPLITFPCPHCAQSIEVESTAEGVESHCVATCPHCSGIYMRFVEGLSAFGTITLFTEASLKRIRGQSEQVCALSAEEERLCQQAIDRLRAQKPNEGVIIIGQQVSAFLDSECSNIDNRRY